MIKLSILFFAALPLWAAAQKNEDRIILKNGKTVSGRIFKMDGDKIHLVKTADSVIYSAGEIISIRFCDPENGDSPVPPVPPTPCNGEGAGTFSSFAKTPDTGKASVLFKCTMCGGSGNLSVAGENGNNKTTAVYTFAMDKDRHFFSHMIELQPGEYTWKYHDSQNNAAKGKFVVKKGEEKKIILFEQE